MIFLNMKAWIATGAATLILIHLHMPVTQAADLAPQVQPEPFSTVVYAGGDAKPRAGDGYLGALYALDGNLGTSGFFVKGQFVYAGWNYQTAQLPSGLSHDDLYNGNASIGYQAVTPQLILSGAVGFDYQKFNFDLITPDTIRLRDHAGAVFSARIANTSAAFPAVLEGSYSTANTAYWVHAAPGMRLGNFVVGPEGIVLGNRVYNEYRAGGFASYDFSHNLILKVDAGYVQSTRSYNMGFPAISGAYGGLSIVFLR